jgi:hypothetical protein
MIQTKGNLKLKISAKKMDHEENKKAEEDLNLKSKFLEYTPDSIFIYDVVGFSQHRNSGNTIGYNACESARRKY